MLANLWALGGHTCGYNIGHIQMAYVTKGYLLKYHIPLISYIYYLHLEAFEFYNLPTIACSKVLTCDYSVCSLKEPTSLTDFWSSAEVSSLPYMSALFFLHSLFKFHQVYVIFIWRDFSLFLVFSLSELSLSLQSELEFTGAAYVTFCAGLPFLSYGMPQSSSWASWKCSAWAFAVVPSNWFLRWNVTGAVFSIIL